MDYKEKYEQALQRAKQFSETPFLEDSKGIVEYIFPELAESEDERIRKHLIKHFGNKSKEDWNGVPVKSILAWLKKQGEQKPANKVIEEEKPLLEKFKQAVYDCAWGKVTCKKEGESKEEYANRWAEQLLSIVRDWAEDYIDSREDSIKRRAYDKGKNDTINEQKPADKIEPKFKVGDVMRTLQEAKDGITDGLPVVISVNKDCYDCTNELIFIKDQDNYEYPPINRKQNTAWSEEDELYIRELESIVKQVWATAEHKNDKDTIHKMSDLSFFLKTLKPQSQWKPSGEQFNVLNEVINFAANHESPHWNDYIFGTLNNLIRQLKKLREK